MHYLRKPKLLQFGCLKAINFITTDSDRSARQPFSIGTTRNKHNSFNLLHKHKQGTCWCPWQV